MGARAWVRYNPIDPKFFVVIFRMYINKRFEFQDFLFMGTS